MVKSGNPIRRSVRTGDRQWTADVDEQAVSIEGVTDRFVLTHEADGRVRAVRGDDAVSGVAVADKETVWVEVEGFVLEFIVAAPESRSRASSAARPRGREVITPPMSATVVRIAVKPGDHVHAGDTIIVLEAMKMELPIRAPHDAVVEAVHCREGELVQPETVLVDLK